MTTVLAQLRSNLVAIVSLVVAFSALGYNTWRNERTEQNRNIRVAGIELLRGIGSLQQLILYIQYEEDDVRRKLRADPRMGWADVSTISDMASVMPPAVVREAENLRIVWSADSAKLAERRPDAFQRIDAAIEQLRQTTLESLRALD